MEVSLFLRDAIILTLIDLVSFFTSIRIKENTRDFWTYDGGIYGKVRSNRLVQGNSESPAIAQALIIYVLQSIPQLKGKLLGYIDNIYLKSNKNNIKEHIKDISILVKRLSDLNMIINIPKSIFCEKKKVNILGYE